MRALYSIGASQKDECELQAGYSQLKDICQQITNEILAMVTSQFCIWLLLRILTRVTHSEATTYQYTSAMATLKQIFYFQCQDRCSKTMLAFEQARVILQDCVILWKQGDDATVWMLR